MNPRDEVERTAREAYGRLLSALAREIRDLQTAEDVLSWSLVRALECWTIDGIPENPRTWLLTVAQNRHRDFVRKEKVRSRLEHVLIMIEEEKEPFRETRVPLLFLCAHPAIDRTVHAPLMMQVIFGLSSEHIASAFLVSPHAMAKRLVRAKKRIKELQIPFELPDSIRWDARVRSVLNALYGAFTKASDFVSDEWDQALCDEAQYLTELIFNQTKAPEAGGLLALMLYCDARSEALWEEGEFVPLDEQDVNRWKLDQIRRADSILREVGREQKLGRFQLEAAVNSAHVARRMGNINNWDEIELLFRGLIQMSPSVGARVGYASVLRRMGELDRALEVLENIPKKLVASYQAYWVVKSEVLEAKSRETEANAALEVAVGLTRSPQIRRFLLRKFGERSG